MSWRGNDCSDEDGWAGGSVCWVAISSSSGQINFGGTGTAYTFKEKASTGVRTLKGAISVSTFALDATAVSSTYGIGTSSTDSSGSTDVWVVNQELSGSSLTLTNISGVYFDASGPAGIASELNATFGVGDTTSSNTFFCVTPHKVRLVTFQC